MLRFLECSIFVENRKLKENKKNTPNGQTSKPLPKTKNKQTERANQTTTENKKLSITPLLM
jgi:hypothetical protein